MSEIRESYKLHLTKNQRLPKCYKEVEKIIKSVKSCQINFKTALQNSRLRGYQFKKVYKLTLNVLKYYNYIQKIIEKTQLLRKEKLLRKEIATILIYELLFGNGSLPGESIAVITIQAHQNDLMNVHQVLQCSSTEILNLNEIYRRYVRVHTLVTTVANVIKDLENYGFKQIFYDESLSEEKYLQHVRSLEKGYFLVDFHFKDILVFAQDENLVGLDLYGNGHIFLQDKASYIPVHVLNPEPGSTVLDACAAPGMKSAHIAAKMKNKGTLIVCERDESRFETLKETLEYGAVKISKALCTDFKLINPNDEAYSAVEYILLDPSCSGSGMVNRMDEVTDTEDSKTKERLNKLAGFQIILLKHALKFPSVKRVVYSTCSIHEEENEYVVHEVLNAFGNNFKLIPVMPEWSVRGSENYEYGELCLRAVPEKHLTNGFFVAMFERIDCHEQGRENFPVNDDCSVAISSEKFNSPSKKLKLKTIITQKEISCERKKKDESTEKNLMTNNNKHEESSSSVEKKKKYDSYIQQCTSPIKNYDNFQLLKLPPVDENCSNSGTLKMPYKTSASHENADQIVEDKIHSSYLIEKREVLKSPDIMKHKKKKGKEYATDRDIQFQSNEQSQEGVVNITSSESVQKCKNSDMLESCSPFKIYNVVDKNINASLAEKKSNHEKHQSSENKFEINERNCETLTDVQKKKRKKDHAMDENTSSFVEAQGGTYNSDILERGYQNIKNVTHSSCTEESKDLNIKEFTKQKKKKEEEYSTVEVPNVVLSESLQKSKNSQISPSSKLCEAEHKISKDVRHISSENKSEDTDKNYEVFVDAKLKRKRKRQHSTDESAPISVYTQETESGDKIDSIISKPAKKKKTNDFMLPCNMQSECFENKSLKVNGNSSETTFVKGKKNKKRKKYSKDLDCTSNKFSNVLSIDLTGSQNNFENCTSVNSIENSNSVSYDETMKTEQYLADNSSECKENKKHKKHDSKSDSLHEAKNINAYYPDSNHSCTTTVKLKKIANETDLNNYEDILVNSPNQNSSHLSKKNKKKKSKNYGNEKTDDSPNFHDSNANISYVDLVQDISDKLLKSNEVEFRDDPVQNSTEGKSSNKQKRHSKDDINGAKIGVSVINESISTVTTNPNNSFHSEVISTNCHKTEECITIVSQEFDHLLSQEEGELENIVFSDCEVKKKKKKKHKRHFSSHTETI